MKNLIIFITLCLLTITTVESYAQEKFTTYTNAYTGKTYDIKLSLKDEELYIDAVSLDELYDKGGITIRKEQHQDFLNAIAEAKTKYIEWVKTAKENDVTAFNKSMNIKSEGGSYFLYGSHWKFQFSVNLSFDFQILEDEGELTYSLIIRTGELRSITNEHLKVDGFILVFSSVNEIDAFTNEISRQKINAFIAKPKEKDLFKD
ncbi:MAG: hypothetical protein MUP24_05375 [Gillisia sp.]|nr:hypothetical protein [Gillisia sp.]